MPLGTLVRDAETGELLADLTHAGQRFLVVRGGRGAGQCRLQVAAQQSPRVAENGGLGEERWLELELKLVADAEYHRRAQRRQVDAAQRGQAAKPKIADYPFTTVEPSLGVAEVGHRQMTLADIPWPDGGRGEGVGLGLDFLRHIERTRARHSPGQRRKPDPIGDFDAINQELTLFNPALADKPQLVVLNKMDLPEAQAAWPAFEQEIARRDLPVMSISAVTGENVEALLYRVQEMLDAAPAPEAEPLEELPEIAPAPDEKEFHVYLEGEGVWRVDGVAIERIAQMTNWDYYEAVMRFSARFARYGRHRGAESRGRG